MANDALPVQNDFGLVKSYGEQFGIDPALIERALATKHRCCKADERARIWGLTYAERQLLGLRTTGSIDVDKAGRERARRDRYNIKRPKTRAGRAAAKAAKAAVRAAKALQMGRNHQELLESDNRLPLCGVSKFLPSLGAVLSTVTVTVTRRFPWDKPQNHRIPPIDFENRRLTGLLSPEVALKLPIIRLGPRTGPPL